MRRITVVLFLSLFLSGPIASQAVQTPDLMIRSGFGTSWHSIFGWRGAVSLEGQIPVTTRFLLSGGVRSGNVSLLENWYAAADLQNLIPATRFRLHYITNRYIEYDRMDVSLAGTFTWFWRFIETELGVAVRYLYLLEENRADHSEPPEETIHPVYRLRLRIINIPEVYSLSFQTGNYDNFQAGNISRLWWQLDSILSFEGGGFLEIGLAVTDAGSWSLSSVFNEAALQMLLGVRF